MPPISSGALLPEASSVRGPALLDVVRAAGIGRGRWDHGEAPLGADGVSGAGVHHHAGHVVAGIVDHGAVHEEERRIVVVGERGLGAVHAAARAFNVVAQHALDDARALLDALEDHADRARRRAPGLDDHLPGVAVEAVVGAVVGHCNDAPIRAALLLHGLVDHRGGVEVVRDVVAHLGWPVGHALADQGDDALVKGDRRRHPVEVDRDVVGVVLAADRGRDPDYPPAAVLDRPRGDLQIHVGGHPGRAWNMHLLEHGVAVDRHRDGDRGPGGLAEPHAQRYVAGDGLQVALDGPEERRLAVVYAVAVARREDAHRRLGGGDRRQPETQDRTPDPHAPTPRWSVCHKRGYSSAASRCNIASASSGASSVRSAS